jgi:uroporphyrinogen decarboxylase
MTALDHREPDRVPFFNLLTIQGAAILGMSYPEYFHDPANIARGQELLREKFGHDCLYPYYYGATEAEAFGGTCEYNPHGPPQAGAPPFSEIDDLLSYELPDPFERLPGPLQATKILADRWGTEVPILNGVIAPLSLAVLLFGMKEWMRVIIVTPERAREVVQYLLPYSVAYANAFLESGATAVALSNPLASPSMLREKEYRYIAFDFDKEFFARISGPAAFGLAGAPVEPLMPLVVELGAAGVTISASDNLKKIKEEWGTQINLMGNLNNIAMENWTPQDADDAVRDCCNAAAAGGGYVLCDHQGDLPELVRDEVLHQIKQSVETWGTYGDE